MGQESAIWTHIDPDLIPDRAPQRHVHDRFRRDHEAEARTGVIEEDSRAESHDLQSGEGEEEARAIPAIPATAIEAGAGVGAGMAEAGIDYCWV